MNCPSLFQSVLFFVQPEQPACIAIQNQLALLLTDIQLLHEVHTGRHPAVYDRERAAEQHMVCTADPDRTLDLLLAPGHLFMTEGQTSPWMRFNAGYSDSPRLYDFLDGLR